MRDDLLQHRFYLRLNHLELGLGQGCPHSGCSKERLLWVGCRFVAGGDSPEAVARRNGAFKLIPHIVQGSWIVKQSVGETPVLLGRKLTTSYFKCPPPPRPRTGGPPSCAPCFVKSAKFQMCPWLRPCFCTAVCCVLNGQVRLSEFALGGGRT